MTAPLRRVLVRRPDPAALRNWREYGWRAEPDPVRSVEEHEAFCTILEDAGAEVVLAETPVPDDPDAVYVFDPAIVSDYGAILLWPGKERRRAELGPLEADLERAGVPVVAHLEEPADAEGGDTVWLDDHTLLIGRGYRTNAEGERSIVEALPGVDVHGFDLPHHRGSGHVLHLLSLLSPLDEDLVVAYPPLLPVRLVQLLEERAINIVEVPDEEFESMGPNVLALGPRQALALEGNRETRRRMEQAGAEVVVYKGNEISRKGDGGPTCLTRPLLRG
jgi:N-dimethylarginine dimethylaminohydrolase